MKEYKFLQITTEKLEGQLNVHAKRDLEADLDARVAAGCEGNSCSPSRIGEGRESLRAHSAMWVSTLASAEPPA
jgi:hypothetical protein